MNIKKMLIEAKNNNPSAQFVVACYYYQKNDIDNALFWMKKA